MILALVWLLLAPSAVAQSRGCVERPVGPPVDAAVVVPGPRGRVVVTVPEQPAYGTECRAVMPPVRDVLRGEDRPGGLLR